MNVNRRWHTSLLLNDGRVLIVGGCYCPIAEIYNPLSGTFSLTGSMVGSSWFVSGAALLKDGRALVVGDGSIELYDPKSGTFTLTKGRIGVANAVSFLDGRVFVGDSTVAQIYAPETNEFVTLRPGRAVERYYANPATALANGQILFAGGSADSYGEVGLTQATLYDPATGQFYEAGGLHQARSAHTTTLLKDGRVLITGGYNGEGSDSVTGIFSSAELFDPETRTFSSVGEMTRHRDGHTATRLLDGRVLITGGRASFARWPPLPDDTSAELFVPDNVAGKVPTLSLDSTHYCVGANWQMRVEGARPSTEATLMGVWDETPWSTPNWRTTSEDGTFAANGTFDTQSIGNHRLWVFQADKVSGTTSFQVSPCGR